MNHKAKSLKKEHDVANINADAEVRVRLRV